MNKALKRTSLTAALVLAILAGVTTLGIHAASASDVPKLPAGWTMYAADCSEQEGQIYSIDSITGEATPIGAPGLNLGTYCPTQAHYNQVTGIVYLPQGAGNSLPQDAGDGTATVDVSSGVTTALPGNVDRISNAIAGDQSGNMFTYNVASQDGNFAIVLFSVDPVSGNLTEVARATVPSEFPSTEFSRNSFAFNPVNQKFYTILLNQGNDEFVTINPVTAEVTRTGVFIDESSTGINHNTNPWSMMIDSNGVAWIADDMYPNRAPLSMQQLVTVDLTTGASRVVVEEITNETLYPEGGFYSQSFWLIPGASDADSASTGGAQENTLANTGANTSQAAVGAAFALTLGLITLFARRRLGRR